MNRLWPLLLVGLVGCGASTPESHLPLDLFISKAVADEMGSFQVTVLNEGRNIDCLEIQSRCLNQQLGPERVVRRTDETGKSRLAQLFPAQLSSAVGGSREQDVVLTGLPPGKDYVVVIEALSKAEPPTFLGSSCNFQQKVEAGDNARLIARRLVPVTGGPLSCDPRWEK